MQVLQRNHPSIPNADGANPEGEHFRAQQLRLPLWVMLLIVAACSPVTYLFLSKLDNPLIPTMELAAVPTTYQYSPSATPPKSGWVSVEQFDNTYVQPEGELFSVWSTFQVDTNKLAQQEQYAIFIPVLYSNFRVYVGDDLIAQPESMERPLYVNRIPRFYPVTRTQLLESNGEIHVNAVRERPSYYWYYVFAGPFDELSEIYDSHRTQRVIAPVLTLVAVFLLAVAAGVLFALSPRQSFYGWFALTLGLFGCHSAWYLIGDTFISQEVWSLAGRYLMFAAITSILFFHRYFGMKLPRIEWFFVAFITLPAIYMTYCAFFDFNNYPQAMNIYTIATTLTWLYSNAFLIWALTKWRNFEALVLAINSANGFVVGMRDMLFQLDVVTSGYQYYLQYYSAVNGFVFGYLLLRRFADSMRESRELNLELENRVEQKASELEESYAQLNEEQGKRLLAEERSRIMRDMHDGLGGQLIHALALTENQAKPPELQLALNTAITDLRLIIDSLAPEDGTVDVLIASYRHRATSMLEEANIHAQWQLDDDLDVDISPKRALALLRLIQEALTNTVKHANATHVTISLRKSSDTSISLSIEDDGVGIAQASSNGRGLTNMKVRARELGSELTVSSTGPNKPHSTIHSTKSGTTISCDIPIGDGIAEAEQKVEQTKGDTG